MSIDPIEPKPQTEQLKNIIEKFYDQMNQPQFRIIYPELARYILHAGGEQHEGFLTRRMLRDALSRIGYAPQLLIDALMGDRHIPIQDRTTCTYMGMVSMYSLLTLDFLPPAALRESINKALHADNGDDLLNHIIDSLNDAEKTWLEAQLERLY